MTNVLLIGVDSLRPQISCYGFKGMVTPNFDRLASSGVFFTQAYCQMPPCAPSRASVFSGCRPDTTKVHDNNTPLNAMLPDAITMSGQFKKSGYEVHGVGQVLHNRNKDDPTGWTEPLPKRRQIVHQIPENRAIVEAKLKASRGPDENGRWPSDLWPHCKLGPQIEAADVPDDAYIDGMTTNDAVEKMRLISGQPFFLAVGYISTHFPLFAPRRYWDLYDDERLESLGSLSAPSSGKRRFEHAYCACVSYIDAQVGRLLDELDHLGLSGKTIVILWVDHGTGQGKMGMHGKSRLPESLIRVPLMIRDPRMDLSRHRIDALAENVDIYPTLCDLCDLPLPDHLEGISLTPIMMNPVLPWKSAAFSQHRSGDVMGYSIRTDRYRFTRWHNMKNPGSAEKLELFDLHADPIASINMANLPENMELQKKLAEQLDAGWRGALPPRTMENSNE